MSSVLFIEPVSFGSNPKIKDNAFISVPRVSASQANADEVQAFRLIREMNDKLRAEGIDSQLIRALLEPRGKYIYADKGDAIFPNNYISFHNFTDDEGKITRRVVILYPMSPYRRGELPVRQVSDRLAAAAAADKLQLVDLRFYEEQNRALEGTGAINFSYNGTFAYMSRSSRSDEGLLDIVCSEANLNIPAKNRFLFSSAIPRADGGSNTVYHTNVIGWCGKGICAWGLDYMQFDTPDAKAAFMRHLEEEYQQVLHLSKEEIEGFAGNSLEVATHDAEGKERRMLFMSETAERALQGKNRRRLEEWYGVRNIITFYGEVVERRTGGSIRCLMCASVTHGEVIPSPNEKSTLQIAGIERFSC